MSQNIQTSSGRLYLSKDPIVHVELANLLEQHEIEGIRFLFRQFKKKNPGVILNDPLGYSHTLQVVLFINAICTLINRDRAVLILCHHNNISAWTEYFQKWTKSSDDLAIDVSNPFLKKSIFIGPIDKLDRYCRRDWGITVVDHDDFLRCKQHSSQLNADYKIYITPHDMKENLDKFSAIFKWFHPKGQLNIDEFRPNANNLKDVIAKTIIFQAFVEDIVLRRNIILAERDIYKNPPSPMKIVTKKNKDATGTKIKRSKRKADDSTEVPNVDSKIRCEIDLAGSRYHIACDNSTDLSISNDIDNEVLSNQCDVSSDMDVESFIRSHKPIQSDVFKDFVPDLDDNVLQCSSKSEDIEENQNINEVDKSYRKDEKFVSVSYVLSFNDNDEKIECRESTMQLHYSEDDSQNLNSIEKDNDQLPQSKQTQVDNEIEDDPVVKLDVDIENKNISSELSHLRYDTPIESIGLEKITENHLNKNKDLKSNLEKERIANKEPGDNVKITTGKIDLDDKLKELEEKTLKKFKGSLLDRIF